LLLDKKLAPSVSFNPQSRKEKKMYLLYIVVAITIPIILVDYPPPDERARRFVLAIISGIIGGVITGLMHSTVAVGGELSALVFALSAGTVLYGIAYMVFGPHRQ
jgi:hypothetical protein